MLVLAVLALVLAVLLFSGPGIVAMVVMCWCAGGSNENKHGSYPLIYIYSRS